MLNSCSVIGARHHVKSYFPPVKFGNLETVNGLNSHNMKYTENEKLKNKNIPHICICMIYIRFI